MPVASSIHVFHRTFQAMGTRFTLVLPDVGDAKGQRLATLAEEDVLGHERLLSRYDIHSPLSEINRRAGGESMSLPLRLWEILMACHEHWERSDGAFDITRALPLASGDETGFQQVILDARTRSVRFQSPGVQLCFGGIGKGIALESVTRLFRQHGITCAFLSFGESSISVIGSHPSGLPWPVGIADLFRPDVARHNFSLRDASISTSGNRPSQDGHIVGKDGRVASGCRTMSVACASAIDAEVLSTALLTLPGAERAPVLANYPGVSAVEIDYESQPGREAGIVMWKHGC